MFDLLEQFQIFTHLTAFLLGMPRLFTAALIVPFLGTGVLEGTIWFTLVFALYLPIHPAVVATLTPEVIINLHFSLPEGFKLAALFVKECLLGLAIGMLASFPFWALQSAGAFIDNQRGASQSEETEIMTGKSVTPTGGLLFQCLVYLFYASGAFLLFLSLLYASFEIWPVPDTLPIFLKNIKVPLYFAKGIADMMTDVILLAAPITVACLLIDISLGLINRFAQQLNAYVLAMPIKSGLASFLLVLYLGFLVNRADEFFHKISDSFLTFKAMLGF